MKLKSWLHSFGRNLRRTRCNGQPAAIEQMEDRTLLSVAALFVNGELFVSSDGGDSISIQQNAAGRVEVRANGAILGTTPNVATSSVTSIVVKGGDAANNINLDQVTNVTYPNLSSIRVDGGNGNDTIVGSPFYGDSLLGGDGKDTISGQAGADTIDGGDGTDSIIGGDGNDSLIGEDGNDTITGDAGDDIIAGGNHQDSIDGGAGNDTIDSGQSNDVVNGGDGDDFINGMDGADVLNGDAGNDSILGGALDDTINGGDGNDTLLGQAGQDSIDGQVGDDSLSGGDGNDVVIGNVGNDVVNGDAGNDSLFGNEGNDQLLGGSGSDVLDGFIGNDTLLGQGGSDTLKGGGGIDVLDGGAGNDLVDSADPTPDVSVVTVAVSSASIAEGNAGNVNLAFTITLSAPSFLPVSVTVSTADGSATAGSDYTTIVNQLVTFAPGTTTQTVNVVVAGDATNEVDDTVRLLLSSPVNASLQNQEAIGTITNDDAAPIVLFGQSLFGGGLSVINPATAASTQISNPGLQPIDLVQDANGQLFGLQGNFLFRVDPNNGAVTFTTNVFGLPNAFNGDLAFDAANNALYAVFSGIGNPQLFRIDPTTGTATNVGGIQVGTANLAANADFVEFDQLAFRNGTLFGVISNGVTGNNANFNDALFSINPVTAVATRIGPLGVNLGTFEGGLEADTSSTAFFLIDGTNGNFYNVNSGTGAATLVGNTGLFGATSLTFGALPAAQPRRVSVSDVVITEGDQGTKIATFSVTAGPGTGAVTLNYSTVDGTATAGIDYVATSGSLTFGNTGGTQSVQVTINGDYSFEGDQTFFLQLSNVTGAVVADGSGNATITNDDAPPLGDTVLGGSGNDTLVGGPADDFMNGGDGSDLINGNGGNDTIFGGSGPDTINGGEGNDSIDGQGGPDVIDGGNGDDIFVWRGASSGNDTVTNASGSDSVQVTLDGSSNVVTIGQSAVPLGGIFSFLQVTDGGATLTVDSSVAQVIVDGGNGDDTITVNDIDRVCRGAVTVRGNKGDDVLTGLNAKIGQMRLRMEGGDGNDTIVGTSGDDTLSGDAGIDRIKAGLGDDLVLGGAGIDTINGEGGNDTLIGGDGSDTLVGDGADTLFGDAGNDSLIGDQGNDILSGGEGDDTANGGDGNDTITGDNGNDSLLGGSALDSITGGNGDDTLDGGRNDDVLNGGAGNDKIRGDHGNDSILGGSGDDTINGGDGDDVISGQAGNDLITGADGDDVINGNDGDDIITGGDGDDTLIGGNGNDIVLGDQGDDLINGQGSTDTLAGGQGDDTIISAAAGEVNEKFVLSALILSELNAN
ncbi:MAG: hypothetical protein NT013_23785 [Planctomycetia bacterium]|nr:hypothetical protein [Planctomycetia bacterium]